MTKFILIFSVLVFNVFASDQFCAGPKRAQVGCVDVNVETQKEQRLLQEIFDLNKSEEEYNRYNDAVQKADCNDTSTWPFSRCFIKSSNNISKQTGVISKPKYAIDRRCCENFKSQNNSAAKRRVEEIKEKRDGIISQNIDLAVRLTQLISSVASASCIKVSCSTPTVKPKVEEKNFVEEVLIKAKALGSNDRFFRKEKRNYCAKFSSGLFNHENENYTVKEKVECVNYITDLSEKLLKLKPKDESYETFKQLSLEHCGISPSFRNIGCFEYADSLLKYFKINKRNRNYKTTHNELIGMCIENFENGDSSFDCFDLKSKFQEKASKFSSRKITEDILDQDFSKTFNRFCNSKDLSNSSYTATLYDVATNYKFRELLNPFNTSERNRERTNICKKDKDKVEDKLCETLKMLEDKINKPKSLLTKAKVLYEECEKLNNINLKEGSKFKSLYLKYYGYCLRYGDFSLAGKTESKYSTKIVTLSDLLGKFSPNLKTLNDSCESFSGQYRLSKTYDDDDIKAFYDQCNLQKELKEVLRKELYNKKNISLLCVQMTLPRLSIILPSEKEDNVKYKAKLEARRLYEQATNSYKSMCKEIMDETFKYDNPGIFK